MKYNLKPLWHMLGFVIGLTLVVGFCARIEAHEAHYKPLVVKAAHRNYIPQDVLVRLVRRESAYRHDVATCTKLGPNGELGLMQLHPFYHKTIDACDPEVAIEYGAKYLSTLYSKTGSWWKAAAAYNWGIGNLTRAKSIPIQVVDYANYVTGVD